MDAKAVLAEAGRYLLGMLGEEVVGPVRTRPWPRAGRLPPFLSGTYIYRRASLFGRPCLLMLARAPEGETPAAVRKHWEAMNEYFEGDVIYLVGAVSSWNRKRLIEHRVPFIVPGSQLYLPPLGVSLRERFGAVGQAGASTLGAPAQVIVLRQILRRDCFGRSAKSLARMLGYSPMSVTRAVRELTGRRLAEVESVGREKHLRFRLSGRALWEAARPALRDPADRRVLVARRRGQSRPAAFGGHVAGESALSRYTDLADTGVGRRAIPVGRWPALAGEKDVHVLDNNAREGGGRFYEDRDAIRLELWAYDPAAVVPGEPCVDPLSLWLSLAGCGDERVEAARETLLKRMWGPS